MNWATIADKLGVIPPTTFRQAFDPGVPNVESEYFEFFHIEHIVEAPTNAWMPTRFVQFATNMAGDKLGLYFPRETTTKPFVGYWASAGTGLWLMTHDVGEVFKDPDGFDLIESNGTASWESFQANTPHWSHLLPVFDSSSTLDELLKPIVLMGLTWEVYLAPWAPLLEQPELPQFLEGLFSEPDDLSLMVDWLDLAERLANQERYDDALNALDNAHTSISMGPHCGTRSHDFSKLSVRASTRLRKRQRSLVLDKMEGIFALGGGDQLDRVCVKAMRRDL